MILTENGKTREISWDDFTQTSFREFEMKGSVKFKVTAGEDIKDDDGNVLYFKGDTVKFVKKAEGVYSVPTLTDTPDTFVDTVETDTEGNLKIENLPVQRGRTISNVQEAGTYENYQIDPTVRSFTFKRKGNEEPNQVFTPEERSDGKTYKIDNKEIDLHTTAVNAENNGKQVNDSSIARIKDTVAYTGLTVGKQYKATGTLMDKETKLPVLIGGKEVTAESTFTAEKADSTVDVVFEFDASDLGGHKTVAFEHLYDLETGDLIANHEDIDDKDQTVDISKVEIKTTVNVGEKKVSEAAKNVTITDKVQFKGLTTDMEYTMHAVLMDKAENNPININGKEVTAEKTFTANGTSDDFINVNLPLDASSLKGKDAVVFETCTHKVKDSGGNEQETIVAEHKDINDKDQTVTFAPGAPATGTGSDTMPYIIGGCTAVVLLGYLLIVSRRHHKASD